MTAGVPVRTGSHPTGMLELRFLGEARALAEGHAIDAFASARVRNLVGYLVLHRDAPVPRQRLAFVFWPDSSEAQARTNLRNLLHTARRAHALLDAAIDVTQTTLQWRSGGAVDIDIDHFVTAGERALTTDPDDADELIQRCEEAVSHYAGELLPDDRDDWLVPFREDLAERHTGVLRLLATALIDAGRATQAVTATQRLVRFCPLDEVAHRLNIEAHAATGDRSGAVRAYHECVAVLDRELGVAPDSSTQQRFEALVDRDATAVPDQRPAHHRTGLVGRAAEWKALEDAWQATLTAGARLVVVSGEPGIGKTRLIDEFVGRCHADNVVVGQARSYVAEGELGFAVVASWLRSPDLAGARQRLGDEARGQLARLLPEIGAPDPNGDLDEADRRRLLFDAVVALLSDAGPTLLVADDIQWGDRASHELIHYLIRRRLDAPLLVVVTARAEDIDTTHPMTTMRDSLAAIDRAVEISLRPLPRAETATLGEHLVGRSLADDDVAALFAESDGNPLFIVETIRSGWDGHDGPAGPSRRLRAVIDARLRMLSTAARSVAAAASVIGRPFAPDLLRAVIDLDDRELAPALDELWRRNILREAGVEAYDFSHARIREAAYDELSPTVRRACHAALAEALSGRAGDRPDGEIAAHLEAAGRLDEAVTSLQRAAESAQRIGAYSDALRLIERALALIPKLEPECRHERELELLSTLPLALAGIDGYGTARMIDAQERAVDVASSLGVDVDPALVRSMVMSALCRNEFDHAADVAARLHQHAIADRDEALRVESHYLLGIASFWGADPVSAREHFETVVRDFDAGSRIAHHARFGHDPQVVCQSRLANTLWFLGHDDDARITVTAALDLAQRVGHPLSHDTAMIFASLLAVDLGDHHLLREVTDRLGAHGLDSLPHRIKRDALVGYLDVVDDRVESGLAATRDALDRCAGRNFYPGFQATIARILVSAHALADDDHGGLDAASNALSMSGTSLWMAEHQRLRATFLARTGADLDLVLAELDRAESTARAQAAHGLARRVVETRKRLTKRS